MLKLSRIAAVSVAILAVCALSACAAWNSFTKSGIAQVLGPDAINLAVAAAVGVDKGSATVRAQKIHDIAATLLADETALTSPATLQADVLREISKLNLPAPDLVLAQGLASALDIAVQAYLTTNVKGAAELAAAQAASVAISAVLHQIMAETVVFGAK